MWTHKDCSEDEKEIIFISSSYLEQSLKRDGTVNKTLLKETENYYLCKGCGVTWDLTINPLFSYFETDFEWGKGD